MTLTQYTVESMSYLTSGILDKGDQDASVEAAMCKVNRSTTSRTQVNAFHSRECQIENFPKLQTGENWKVNITTVKCCLTVSQ